MITKKSIETVMGVQEAVQVAQSSVSRVQAAVEHAMSKNLLSILASAVTTLYFGGSYDISQGKVILENNARSCHMTSQLRA
jgi:hypothetical protein